MAKKRLDTEDVFKSIMGSSNEVAPKIEEITEPMAAPEEKRTEMPPFKETKKERGVEDNSLIHRTYYITKKQYKALKLKAATSDDPQDKDLSAIVRAALEIYLAEELKNL